MNARLSGILSLPEHCDQWQTGPPHHHNLNGSQRELPCTDPRLPVSKVN